MRIAAWWQRVTRWTWSKSADSTESESSKNGGYPPESAANPPGGKRPIDPAWDTLGAATLPHVVIAREDRGRAVPPAALEMIARWEGYRSQAYLCPADVWTIGYGTTRYPDGRRVKAGDLTTPEAAMAMLRDDAMMFAAAVDRMVHVTINQNERAALISFTYNFGAPKVASSTLVRLLNKGDRAGAALQFHRWNKADGKVLAGLVARRVDEARLFGKPA